MFTLQDGNWRIRVDSAVRPTGMRSLPVLLAALLAVPSCRPDRPQSVSAPALRPAMRPFLDALEQATLDELNRLRADPAGYAGSLAALLPLFKHHTLFLPGRHPLMTREGPAAVSEAVAVLRAAPPLPRIEASRALSQAASDHVSDIGPRGLTTHDGTDGRTPHRRMTQRAGLLRTTGEVISFGPDEGAQVIISLLVDDGVPGRGHRKLLLDPRFRAAGVSCGPHIGYGTVCVIDLADTGGR